MSWIVDFRPSTCGMKVRQHWQMIHQIIFSDVERKCCIDCLWSLTSFISSTFSSSIPPIPGFFTLEGFNLGATLATGGLCGAEKTEIKGCCHIIVDKSDNRLQRLIEPKCQCIWPSTAQTLIRDFLWGFVESWWSLSRCRHAILALPRLHWIIFFPVIVGIKELLEPLNKFKVVLELSLHQFVYRYYLKEKWHVMTALEIGMSITLLANHDEVM